jgi:hypothetical protein
VIYRILVDECLDGTPTGEGRFGGLANSHLGAGLLDEAGVSSPNFDSRRTRFYFTEAGWRAAGRAIAAKLRAAGHVVRVLRRKEPAASQVVFRDRMQVAILPGRGKGK